MAESEGFEPPIPFQVCRFSRPEPSTTRPALRSWKGSFSVSLQHIASLPWQIRICHGARAGGPAVGSAIVLGIGRDVGIFPWLWIRTSTARSQNGSAESSSPAIWFGRFCMGELYFSAKSRKIVLTGGHRSCNCHGAKCLSGVRTDMHG